MTESEPAYSIDHKEQILNTLRHLDDFSPIARNQIAHQLALELLVLQTRETISNVWLRLKLRKNTRGLAN